MSENQTRNWKDELDLETVKEGFKTILCAYWIVKTSNAKKLLIKPQKALKIFAKHVHNTGTNYVKT